MTNSSRITLALLSLIVIVLVVAVFAWRSKERAEERDVVSEVLFSEEATAAYTDVEGRGVALDEFEQKLLLVTSWASWCPQCAGELELLNRLVEQANNSELRIIAVNRNEPKEQAQRFLATLPPLSRVTYVLDNKDYFFSSVVGFAMPETIAYNAAGEMVYHKRGNFTEDELRTVIESLLASPE